MIVPPGTVLKSTVKPTTVRKVIDVRQLGDKVLFRPQYDGKWHRVEVVSLDLWERWCTKHKARIVE